MLQISAGVDHTCALLHGGRVKCWGKNKDGQLGYDDAWQRGHNASSMGHALKALDLNGRHVVQVSAGSRHTCALISDQSYGASAGYGDSRLLCWGHSGYGQVGSPCGNGYCGRGPSYTVTTTVLGGFLKAAFLPNSNETLCMLNRQRELTLWLPLPPAPRRFNTAFSVAQAAPATLTWRT